MIQKVLIWDVPTRVFHWSQVICFVGAYLTAESERTRDIHLAFGYILLGLIVFRLLWGFIGTHYARFSSFLFNPVEVLAYLMSLLKMHPKHYLGHNPAGSVSVWLLLALGLFICVTGMMALQDDVSEAVIEFHGLATDIMLVVIFLHLLGVLMSSIMHRENLARSMVTGFKFAEMNEGIQRSYAWLGVLMLAVAVVFWFLFLK